MTAYQSKFTLNHNSASDLLISDLLIGWNDFEKRQGHLEFCDFNISKHAGTKNYDNYNAIEYDLKTALSAPDVQSCPITLKRLASLKEHFLIRTQPEKIDLSTHFYKALGHTPVWIDENRVKYLKNIYNEACRDAGLKNNNFEQQLKQYDKQLFPDEIEPEMMRFFQTSRKEIESLVGTNTNFNVKFETQHAPQETWYLWIGGEGRDFKVSINTHFYKDGMAQSDAFLLASHELTGHGIYYSLIADRVENKENPIHAGITTVVGPEVFVAEAVAEIMPIYLSVPKSKIDTAHAANQHHIRAVLNNMVVKNLKHGHEEAKKYGLDNLDEDYHPLVVTRSEDFKNMNPVDTSYLSVYGTVHCNFRSALDIMGKEKFSTVIKSAYENYLMPEDINTLMKEKGAPQHTLFNTTNPEMTL